KAQHELVVSKTNVPVFADRIGFLSGGKRDSLATELSGRVRGFYRESFLVTFKDLMSDGIEEVYDLSEPNAHRFVANGLVVHNCAGEAPPPFGVCNLGALNLAAFVKGGALDYDALAEHARVAVRFLDDVIDASHYFLDENRQAQLGTR